MNCCWGRLDNGVRLKAFTVGCLGVVLGVLIGAASVVGVLLAVSPNVAQDIPILTSSQPDISVTVNSNVINSQTQPLIRQTGLLNQAAVILAAPNVIQVNGVTNLMILQQPVAINTTTTMRVSVRNGRVVLTVDKVDAGGIDLPASLYAQVVERNRAQIEDQLNRMMQRALQGLALHLSNIAVTPDGITLQFKS